MPKVTQKAKGSIYVVLAPSFLCVLYHLVTMIVQSASTLGKPQGKGHWREKARLKEQLP